MNREQLANRVIQDHVTYVVAAGAIPVPLVDLAAVTAVQVEIIAPAA